MHLIVSGERPQDDMVAGKKVTPKHFAQTVVGDIEDKVVFVKYDDQIHELGVLKDRGLKFKFVEVSEYRRGVPKFISILHAKMRPFSEFIPFAYLLVKREKMVVCPLTQ